MMESAQRRLAGLCVWLFAVVALVAAGAVFAGDAEVAAKSDAAKSNQDWRLAWRVPGPNHERLNALIGEWTATIKRWEDPESEATEQTGTATRRWVLDGRFVEEHAEGKSAQGAPYQSVGYLGYNRKTELYERFWMTISWTGVFSERGRYDPDANVIRTEGAHLEAGWGDVILTTAELKIESPSRHVLTAYATGIDGVRWKQLEIVYTKQ
jgi:hypothetical protein